MNLFDFSRDLYGRRLRVEFVQRLREERRFPGVDALKAQIAQDVARARQILGACVKRRRWVVTPPLTPRNSDGFLALRAGIRL
jgi:hypothetical protein